MIVEYIDKKLPPIFVKPCIAPIPTKIIFLDFKNMSLKDENLLLFNIKIDEKINKIATKNLKSMKSRNLSAKTKKIIRNGKQ